MTSSYNADTKLPLFDAAKDTGKYIVTILNNPDKFIGKIVHMASEYVTVQQIVDTLTQGSNSCIKRLFVIVTGKKHVFQKVDRETMSELGAPEDYVSEYIIHLKLIIFL